MNEKRSMPLKAVFTAAVFLIFVVTSLIIGGLAAMSHRYGFYSFTSSPRPLAPIFSILIMSVGVGTVVSAVISSFILKPITRLGNAMKVVSKGDFSIRMNESQRIYEMEDMARNFNSMVDGLSSIETLSNDFVVNVSHEFKTPIAAIEGYAMLIQEPGLSNEDKDEYAGIIVESAQSLSSLAGNILNLSHLEQQGYISDKENYRIDEQIRQAILLLEPLWSKKRLNLEVDLEESVYYGNEGIMLQVWLNLLSNAIKFTPKNGSIFVTLTEDSYGLTARVKDTGSGISPNVRSRIFDKFYQGDDTRATEGNGLGLSLVKRIVELCKGSIEVVSQQDMGAEFVVSLPRDMGDDGTV